VLSAEEQSRLGPRAVLLARAPSVVPTYDRLGNVLANALLDRPLRERVRLRCAGIVGCEY
jgi:alkylhydroperoxidase family enzyme